MVKKCENKETKEVVAAKIIRSDDDEYIMISKREFEVMKSLSYSNIVKVHECIHDQQRGRLYIVMEYINGQTIEDYVNDYPMDKFIPEPVIKFLFKQMLMTIEYLHQEGVCHRDLKPDNLLLNQDTKQLKLMDFNIARRFQDQQNR